jgi:hypothetical protein
MSKMIRGATAIREIDIGFDEAVRLAERDTRLTLTRFDPGGRYSRGVSRIDDNPAK